jgi:hypothetical protein
VHNRAASAQGEEKRAHRDLVERVLLQYVSRLKTASALRAEFETLTHLKSVVPISAAMTTDGDGGQGATQQPTGAEVFRAITVLLFASRLGPMPDRDDHARWLHLAKVIVASLMPTVPQERFVSMHATRTHAYTRTRTRRCCMWVIECTKTRALIFMTTAVVATMQPAVLRRAAALILLASASGAQTQAAAKSRFCVGSATHTPSPSRHAARHAPHRSYVALALTPAMIPRFIAQLKEVLDQLLTTLETEAKADMPTPWGVTTVLTAVWRLLDPAGWRLSTGGDAKAELRRNALIALCSNVRLHLEKNCAMLSRLASFLGRLSAGQRPRLTPALLDATVQLALLPTLRGSTSALGWPDLVSTLFAVPLLVRNVRVMSPALTALFDKEEIRCVAHGWSRTARRTLSLNANPAIARSHTAKSRSTLLIASLCKASSRPPIVHSTSCVSLRFSPPFFNLPLLICFQRESAYDDARRENGSRCDWVAGCYCRCLTRGKRRTARR